MKDDLLHDAILALRDKAPGESASRDVTRMRIVGTVRARKRRRVMVARASAALLCAALGGTAWAAATGRLPPLAKVVELIGAAPRTESAPAPSLALENTTRRAPAPKIEEPGPAPSAPLPSAPVETVFENTEQRSPEAPRGGAVVSQKPSVAKATEKPADASVKGSAKGGDGAAEALYLRAHELHFQSHDYAKARSAWEAYLAAAPAGRFAAFAHYNRALCLVRLGRITEAKRALEPFASGAFGGYRQAEAAALLEALGGAQPVIEKRSND